MRIIPSLPVAEEANLLSGEFYQLVSQVAIIMIMMINCLGLMRFAGSSTSPIQAAAQPGSFGEKEVSLLFVDKQETGGVAP